MARSGVLNVYIENISPRTRWIFCLMLEELLGLKLNLTDKVPSEQPILNYSNQDVPGSLCLKPFGLLSETEVVPQKIVMGKYEGLPVFFSVEGGYLPFDPFSMAFFLISRYEEYLPFKADQHGRYPHTESLAFKEDFLNIPLVEEITQKLKLLLQERFPELMFKEKSYHFLPTIDVDIAYAHMGKGFVRTWGAMAKLLLKGNFKEIGKRCRTMRGKGKDPFDNFDMLLTQFSGHQPDPVFFILAGKPGPFDKNLSLKNKRFASLIRRLSEKTQIGVHPSYGSGNDVGRIKKEISSVEEITGKKISSSRQHFVKMSLPETYESLIKAGITDDYSMGYASISGFRAGIANPYRFYNLKQEEETSLLVHPFMFMDTTLSDYMKLDPADYRNAVLPLIDAVKKVSGELVGIWHNYALEDDENKHKSLEEIFAIAAQQ